jgi:hypothetical protein
MIWTYTRGAELPAITIDALDVNGLPIDFSTGWTFAVKVGEPGKTAVATAATVTGAPSKPNLTIDWPSNALAALVVGVTYTVQLQATLTATGQDRIYTTQLRVVDAVL